MNNKPTFTLSELARIALAPGSTRMERELAISCVYQQGRADGAARVAPPAMSELVPKKDSKNE